MYLEPPRTNEIIDGIMSFNVNKAVVYDNIPLFYLKIASCTLAPYLCILFTYAFENGIFPDNCKVAKIIPIHKSGDFYTFKYVLDNFNSNPQ